jgi:hypothetical protein
MTYEVIVQDYDDLSEDEKSAASNNGGGKDYATYLRIKHNGETIALHSDACEPEDCTFRRDFDWITAALRKAYELGKSDRG